MHSSKPLTITSAGQILRGTTFAAAHIRGTSPRELVANGTVTDVTHVWHSPDLAWIVDALIVSATLPAGYHMRTRRDGVRMVGQDRRVIGALRGDA